MRYRLLGLLASLMTLVSASPAQAGCAALSLCSCNVSTTGIAFGAYDPFTVKASGSITVECTLVVALGGTYDIALSTGSSGSYASRTLKKGGSSLFYNLYTSDPNGAVWGNGSGGTVIVTRSFSALLYINQTTSIYGTVPAGQNVPGGAYADNVVVTITY